MENLTVAELKQRCKSVDIKLTKADGSSKLKKDLIKSLSSVDQSIVGGRKRRSRKGTSSRRRSRKGSKKTSTKRRSRRGSRKVSRRRGSKKRKSKRKSRKVSRRRGSKKRSTKKKSSRRRSRSSKQVGGMDVDDSKPEMNITNDSTIQQRQYWLDKFKTVQEKFQFTPEESMPDAINKDDWMPVLDSLFSDVTKSNLMIFDKAWSDYSYNYLVAILSSQNSTEREKQIVAQDLIQKIYKKTQREKYKKEEEEEYAQRLKAIPLEKANLAKQLELEEKLRRKADEKLRRKRQEQIQGERIRRSVSNKNLAPIIRNLNEHLQHWIHEGQTLNDLKISLNSAAATADQILDQNEYVQALKAILDNVAISEFNSPEKLLHRELYHFVNKELLDNFPQDWTNDVESAANEFVILIIDYLVLDLNKLLEFQNNKLSKTQLNTIINQMYSDDVTSTSTNDFTEILEKIKELMPDALEDKGISVIEDQALNNLVLAKKYDGRGNQATLLINIMKHYT